MISRKITILIIIILTNVLFVNDTIMFAQETDTRKIEEKEWLEITEGKDYTEDFKELKPKQRKRKTNRDLAGIFSLLRVFFGVLIILFLGIVLFLILKYLLNYFDEKVPKNDTEIAVDNLEENLHDADLEQLLKQTLKEGNFGACIRIYYLMIIKALSQKEIIKWKKDKTNRSYINEMAVRPGAMQFIKLTSVYEQVWFGEITIDNKQFNLLETHFRMFLQQIEKGEA